MQNNSKLRKMITAVAALLIMMMVGSTWTYWSQTLDIRNEFQVGKYSTEIVEVFEPPSAWLPGMDINKDVSIKNEGSVPVFVKVTINQKWLRTENIFDGAGNIVPPAEGEELPLVFGSSQGEEYAAEIVWGPDVVLLSNARGLAPSSRQNEGLPTVSTIDEAKGRWLLVSETPSAANNYTLYYIGALGSGKVTPLVVDSVCLNSGIQAAILEEHTAWDKQTRQWVTTTVENPYCSYENARYTMTVTMDTVQATGDAVTETFYAENVADQAVISYLESVSRPAEEFAYSYDDTVKMHKLYFKEVGGGMQYTPVRGNNENWFMSWFNILPGGHYTNRLEIENRSNKTYYLYMQAVPLSQNSQMDALLEDIKMKVYYGNTLIYDGTASGQVYPDSLSNLQNVVLLGKYKPGIAGQIRVELELSKDIPLEYAELLSKIDWKFMADELVPSGSTPSHERQKPNIDENFTVDELTSEPTPTPTPTPTPDPQELNIPKTGDESEILWYILVMCASGVALAGGIICLRKSRKR